MNQEGLKINRNIFTGMRVGFLCLAAAAVLALVPNGALSAEPDTDTWMKALRPLETMPVQDTGYLRSASAFAQDRLLAIHDKRTFEKQPALLAVLTLISNPQKARNAPLLKIMHPELIRIFGGSYISAQTWRDPANLAKLREAVRRNPELIRPANETEARCIYLEELEMDFAILPREHEWWSPAQIDPERSRSPLPQYDETDAEILRLWEALKNAIRANRPDEGAEAAAALAQAVKTATEYRGFSLPPLALDVFYNRFYPFALSAVFYLIAAHLYGASLLFGKKRLHWGGFAFLALGFLAEMLGITIRWILCGRAPLSNMYESFIFATAGMILVALIFEAASRIRLAGFGGSILGFLFMVLAHKLPIFDSAIRPLVPALQSAWLTYHVVTIMLGYSAFALSFFVSVCYLAKDALGGDASRWRLVNRLPSLAALDLFNYKIIAVGFPLLTIGIILGAVWADTAWGRPWGFDPKETWSAITWLVYAVYLHVRFIGGWKGRRAAIIALIGFACVLFTYFGVNYLLPSLHSYVR